VPSAVEEPLSPAVPPATLALTLGVTKAREVAARMSTGTVVLGADTLVVLAGRPFGKPDSRDEARRMLAALAGQTHEVVTGVAVVLAGRDRELTASVVSQVVMRPYTADEIERYVATPEPYDKAGGYAVQGAGGGLVARVEGCYTNVVGLPLATTARLLRAAGLAPTEPSATDRGQNAPR
jgi:septum formation protein